MSCLFSPTFNKNGDLLIVYLFSSVRPALNNSFLCHSIFNFQSAVRLTHILSILSLFDEQTVQVAAL
jgi:hypothetical protein